MKALDPRSVAPIPAGPDRPASAGAWLLLVVPGVIWGASFLFIAQALESVGPNGVTFGRILIGFATLALFPQARRPLSKQGWAGAALLGLIWMALPLSLFPYAEQRVSSALTGMLNSATSLFAAAVAALLARRVPSRGVLGGLAVGFAGTALVAAPGFFETETGAGGSHLDGVLMILVATLSYGFALNLARPLQMKHGALPVLWRAQAVALVLTAPLGARELAAAHWTPGPLLSLLALGALGTGVAFVLTTLAAGRFGATRASSVTFLMPPVALLLGMTVRGESVAPLSIVGGAVCIAGAWLIRRANDHPAAKSVALAPHAPLSPAVDVPLAACEK
jgi:drug/metabolite transporter (DMT)-like permease